MLFAASLIFLLIASSVGTIPEYFVVGFTHILPHGLDHILFLLALFFLNQKFSDLFVQLTLFTLAHSLTLGLSLYGYVSLPSVWVEVAIALSIVFVASENLMRERLSAIRPWVVFASGLIHGFGFAHSFEEKSIPAGDFLPALFSFNLGLEIGQLFVVGAVSLIVSIWWRKDYYRKIIALPASCIIAMAGIFWAVERML